VRLGLAQLSVGPKRFGLKSKPVFGVASIRYPPANSMDRLARDGREGSAEEQGSGRPRGPEGCRTFFLIHAHHPTTHRAHHCSQAPPFVPRNPSLDSFSFFHPLINTLIPPILHSRRSCHADSRRRIFRPACDDKAYGYLLPRDFANFLSFLLGLSTSRVAWDLPLRPIRAAESIIPALVVRRSLVASCPAPGPARCV